MRMDVKNLFLIPGGKWYSEGIHFLSRCEWNSQTCAFAAKNGHFEILKWARQHGCEWNSDTCAHAITYNHFEILRWAHENGCPEFSWMGNK